MPIAVVTDSSACLPAEVAVRQSIVVVPLVIIVGSEHWSDAEICGSDLYDRLKLAHRVRTSAPAPGAFLEAIQNAYKAGADGVLCLTLSSEYSGTYNAAMTAREMAENEWPDLPVRVVDTRCMAMAHGFCVLTAAEAARGAATIDQAVVAAEAMSRRVHLVGVLETTLYLAKGGRVPWPAHWTASLLRIKPVIASSGGKIHAVGRARTHASSIEKMLRHLEDRVKHGTRLHVCVMHADALERAEALAKIVTERYAPAELLVTEVTRAMGVHTGPGFLGLAYYSDEGTS